MNATISPDSVTIYLPATETRPAEPAPYVMTEDDVMRLLRLQGSRRSGYQSLYRYRRKGWLKATQVGNHIRYLLPDVIRFLETAKKENPR